MRRPFLAVIIALFLGLYGCMTPSIPIHTMEQRFNAPKAFKTFNQSEQYLCAIGGQNGNNSVVKIMDLKTRKLRSVFVPGFVQNMAGDKVNKKLYISSTRSGRVTLYEVDIRTASIRYLLAFSQIGIIPDDFLVDGQKLYVAGEKNDQGVLYSYNIINKGWKPIVRNIRAGVLEWGTDDKTLQVIHFGEEDLTRTTVNIPRRKVTNVFTFEHSVPFGNNLGLPSPHGFYFYTLHQLKNQVFLYSHNLTSGVRDVLEDPHAHDGVLYSSVITRDGRKLFASIDNAIQRYELKGTQLVRMPEIELKQPDARHLALSEDAQTLYVSHEDSNKVSRIRFNKDSTYRVDFMAFPGKNNELVVF